jgi:hypothetical protein
MNPDIEFIRGLHVRLGLRIKGMQQVAQIHREAGNEEMTLFFEGGYDALKDIEKTLKRYLEEKEIK